MAEYDLREYRALPWVRFLFWFRAGMGTFATALTGWVIYDTVRLAMGPGLSGGQLAGLPLIVFILAMFLFFVAALRPGAAERLVIDGSGVRIVYRHGQPLVRLWDARGTTFRGRRTDGVRDTVSFGRPLWSVYGRFGAFTEAFIPEAAFDELLRVASKRGMTAVERPGKSPGWVVYHIAH